MKMYDYQTKCSNCDYKMEISSEICYNIGETTGVKCPNCGIGEMIVIKRSGD